MASFNLMERGGGGGGGGGGDGGRIGNYEDPQVGPCRY
jgi:hypothetical protein